MTRPIFWACWNYGQGALWTLVRANSADQVRTRFSEVEVFEAAPTTLDEDTRAIISKSGVQDVEAAPSGWLKDLAPPPTQSISSMLEFESLVALVQRQLRDGTLKQCSAGDADLPPSVDVLHLPPGGPWPDVIEATFVDAHGHPYHLFVDCYHGIGLWQDPTAIAMAHSCGTSPKSSGIEELPDWEFEVREVSAGVYRANGSDRGGRRVVTEGVDPDTCLEECRSAALKLVCARQGDSTSPDND